MRLRIALPILLLSLGLPFAATGTAAAASPSAGAQPVIQVRETGGFVPVEVNQGEVPVITVTADGRVITRRTGGPFDRMARLRIARIDDARIQELFTLAEALGLRSDDAPDYGEPQVTDLQTTTVTISIDGDRFSVSAYALGFDEGPGIGLTDAQLTARDALQEFIAEVADASPRRPFQPKRVAALATPVDDATGNAVEWPLADLASAGEAAQLAARCVIVGGDELDLVLPLAERARFATRWTSGSGNWRIVFRPLLPNERTCGDIEAL